MTHSLSRKIAAEFLGTFFLLCIVVGSGIMGDRLSNGTPGLALLANSFATGTGLAVLILVFGGISGAHFNPLVSLAEAFHNRLSRSELALYVGAQVLGALGGVVAAHIMFGEPYFMAFSTHDRSGMPGLFSEFVATFGLIAVIRGVNLTNRALTPFAVGAYIASAYWFTASTSFANPTVTIARAFTQTFAGIRPSDVPGFCVAQLFGAVTAEFTFKWFERSEANI